MPQEIPLGTKITPEAFWRQEHLAPAFAEDINRHAVFVPLDFHLRFAGVTAASRNCLFGNGGTLRLQETTSRVGLVSC